MLHRWPSTGFWKDCILAELQVKMSRSCRFLIFLPHKYQVTLRAYLSFSNKCRLPISTFYGCTLRKIVWVLCIRPFHFFVYRPLGIRNPTIPPGKKKRQIHPPQKKNRKKTKNMFFSSFSSLSESPKNLDGKQKKKCVFCLHRWQDDVRLFLHRSCAHISTM